MNTPQTTTIFARVMVGATLYMVDGTTEEYTWPERHHGSIPVCHGGALSIETWETSSNQYLEGVVHAPGTWKKITVRTALRKIEILNPNQQPGASH